MPPIISHAALHAALYSKLAATHFIWHNTCCLLCWQVVLHGLGATSALLELFLGTNTSATVRLDALRALALLADGYPACQDAVTSAGVLPAALDMARQEGLPPASLKVCWCERQLHVVQGKTNPVTHAVSRIPTRCSRSKLAVWMWVVCVFCVHLSCITSI